MGVLVAVFFRGRLVSQAVVLPLVWSVGAGSVDAQNSTGEFCSPIIDGVASGANVTIQCNLTREEASALSLESFEEAYWALNRLAGQQSNYLLPLLTAFSENPSQEKWDAVQQEVMEVSQLVKHAREALFVFETTLPIDQRNKFKSLHGLLSKRSIALLYIFENRSAEFEVSALPKGLEQLNDWIASYGTLVQELEREMSRVVEAMERVTSDLR